MKTLRTLVLRTALCGVISLGLAQKAHAVNLVQNGGFEVNGGNGQLGFNTTATGWSISGGYTFLYAPSTADTTGANGQYGNVPIWGPGNGVANGLPATSPAGGYFAALDSDFQQAPITQTINGLTVGANYNLSFYWAAAQQAGFTGATSDYFQVALGSQTQNTPTLAIASQGFSGWVSQDLTYTATSTSEVLSFLANSPSGGAPPFALLDGVSLTPATAPDAASTGLLLGVATTVMGFAARYRRRCRK
jgi:hypothetical protein